MGLFKFKNKEYDKVVTDAINGIDFPPIAIEGEFKLFCGTNEIGGYNFLNCNIVGPFQVRSSKGCYALINNGNEELEIESETVEINSDYSDTLSLGVTAFVIELESKLENWINEGLVKSIRFKFPKKSCEYHNIDAVIFKDLLKKDLSEEE